MPNQMYKNTYYMPTSRTYFLASQHLSIKWNLNLNTNDKGVFLLCKQKSHCFGTALSVSAGQMAHEFEQDAT